MIIAFLTRALFAAYFLEAGLILIVAPWSGFWDRNFFAARIPAIDAILESSFARGAVSGLGAITVIAGLVELAGLIGSRRSRTATAADLPQAPTTPKP